MRRVAMASDIDGTLIFHTSGNHIGADDKDAVYHKEEDMAAIAAWQAEGLLFGVCSGRPLVGVFDLLPAPLKPDFYIACCGAAIFDKNRRAIFEATIEPDVIRNLFDKYAKYALYSTFHTDVRDTLFGTVKNESEELKDIKQVVVISLNDILDKKIYSISMIFHNDKEAEAVCADINKDGLALAVFQNNNSLDIVSRGCSKGEGILRIKKYLQVDVVAGIGDSFNDLPMLLTAQPSFTFRSSPDAIRNRVTYVVDSVAEALEIMKGEIR